MRWLTSSLLLLAGFSLASGCSRNGPADAISTPVAPTASPSDAALAPPRVVLDIVRDLDACALGHRGVLLDFGDATLQDDLSPGTFGHDDDEVVEHEGATWLRVRSRSLTTSFYWPSAASESSDGTVFVEGRVRGVIARTVAVAIDGKPVGNWTLDRDGARSSTTRSSSPMTLVPGGHELSLRFVGGPRTSKDALAEIDWAHIGTGDRAETYAAPTRAEVLLDAALGGRSLRALSLHAPGFVRCSGWLPSNATLEVSLATAGGGDAEVEARVLRDRHPPVVLGAAEIVGGAAGWTLWSVPISGLEGEGALAAIEILIKRAAKGTRVLLGEPRIVLANSTAVAPPARARSAVVVVLGSTSAKRLAPWGGEHRVPELARLASSGTTFTANRASSSLASAVVASALTGLSPRAHGLEDLDARLPKGPTTLQDACRQGGIETAMFTANPTTGVAFGFGRGWDLFVAHDPLEDVPSRRVFEDAAAFIESKKDKRFLVVVHARGGHPPWDIAPEELRSLPPHGYFGMIEPRRAAEALAKARRRGGRFKEEDGVRAWALYDHAIDAEDEALGTLLGALRAIGREDDTLIIVTGDVGTNEAPPVPFVETKALDEPLLATPLVVRFPPSPLGSTPTEALSGKRVDAPSSTVDLARTVLAALDLMPPASFEGVDLSRLAQGAVMPPERPLMATNGDRFAVRWGSYVLQGAHHRELRMCDLSLDPTCVADIRGTSPLALEPVRRLALRALGPSASAWPRESA
ncbi:MAG: sulfatase-like hydrolase/transferase, partial [Myxococcota bacterium]|nr:sulfatase-like hydrolase/transferase [Myxococcota bacterium]